MTPKQHLRQTCLARRQSLTTKEKHDASEKINGFLDVFLQPYRAQTTHILCYQSLPHEVSTANIFHQQKNHHYYAPVTHQSGDMHWLSVDPDSHWKQGNFQIPEPTEGELWSPQKAPAILICPLVGFDRYGNRIGMGKGCFDRWLAAFQHAFDHIIGLAFSCQACDYIPHESHDIPLHAVITEEGYIPCQNT